MNEQIAVRIEGTGYANVPFWLASAVSGNALKLWILIYQSGDFQTKVSDGRVSRATLAKDMGMNRPQSIDKYIQELEDAGALLVERSRREGTKEMNPNKYTLLTSTPGGGTQKRTTPSTQNRTGVVRKSALGWYAKPHSKDSLDSSLENTAERAPETVITSDADASDSMLDLGIPVSPAEAKAAEFDSWYAIYPKHAGEAAARRAFNAARKKTSLEELKTKAKLYAKLYSDTPVNFLTRPDRWLMDERWKDEELNGVKAAKEAELWKAGIHG